MKLTIISKKKKVRLLILQFLLPILWMKQYQATKKITFSPKRIVCKFNSEKERKKKTVLVELSIIIIRWELISLDCSNHSAKTWKTRCHAAKSKNRMIILFSFSTSSLFYGSRVHGNAWQRCKIATTDDHINTRMWKLPWDMSALYIYTIAKGWMKEASIMFDKANKLLWWIAGHCLADTYLFSNDRS